MTPETVRAFVDAYLDLEQTFMLAKFDRGWTSSTFRERFEPPREAFWAACMKTVNHDLEKIEKYEPISDADLEAWRSGVRRRTILSLEVHQGVALGEKLRAKLGADVLRPAARVEVNGPQRNAMPEDHRHEAWVVATLGDELRFVGRDEWHDESWQCHTLAEGWHTQML